MGKTATKKRLFQILLLLCALFMMTVPANAATKKNTWVYKNGRYYYYNSKGNLSKGTKKIGNKYYFFNSKGRQRNGWVQTHGNYYYFRWEKGKGGYRLSSQVVDGIQLGKDGKAVVTSANAQKLKLLRDANYIVYNKTSWKMTRPQALRACFNYLLTNFRYQTLSYGFSPTADWPERYAEYVMYRGYGNCYAAGAGFAYIATCLGFDNVYAVSSGGHGWCEIDGLVYDPDWAWVTRKYDHYFGLSRSQLQGNDPNYFRYGIYRRRID